MTDQTTAVRDAVGEAVTRAGLQGGMRISFHHHLRFGDRVVGIILKALQELGCRNLTLCVSSIMGPACESVLKAVRAGVVIRIETTGMKEPLASAVLNGEITEPVLFRTHGGRARKIERAETPIDLAFIAVSAVDSKGNANGVDGPSCFGSLGYALVDAEYARYRVAVTDHRESGTLAHISIPASSIDQVIFVESIGDTGQLTGGSLRSARRPLERIIADRAAHVLAATAVRQDFCFQAGSGVISLATSRAVASYMRERSIRGGFASGGVTEVLTAMLEEGLISRLYDVQSFDDVAAASLKGNPGHLEMSASDYANPDRADCIAHRLDAVVLSASEVDVDFNVNSLTGTDGGILGALGGAPDTAEGATVTMVVMPALRGRIPTVRPRVQTICTPGTTVDVVVTERGICVNPQRDDLRALLSDARIPTLQISQLCDAVSRITGEPAAPARGSRTVAVVESRRGDALDTIRSAE